MAGVIGLVNLLGEPSADRIATGIGAERDVGVPEGRQTVVVTRGDMPMTGRIGLTTGANNGNGSLLQEIGTTGVFTGVAPGDVYGIGDQVRAAHAGAGANPPNAWSSQRTQQQHYRHMEVTFAVLTRPRRRLLSTSQSDSGALLSICSPEGLQNLSRTWSTISRP